MKTNPERQVIKLLTILFLSFLGACGGGGGGSGGGDGSGQVGRSSGLGLRVMHSAIDGAPIDVSVASQIRQRARYGEARNYFSIPSGPQIVQVFRANSPDVIYNTLEFNFLADTEYSLLFAGSARNNNLQAIIIEDLIARPEPGNALLRMVNGRQSNAGLILISPLGESASVSPSTASEFLELPAGPHVISISRSGGGNIWEGVIDLPDRGEVTLLVTGSDALGVTFVTQFFDFD